MPSIGFSVANVGLPEDESVALAERHLGADSCGRSSRVAIMSNNSVSGAVSKFYSFDCA